MNVLIVDDSALVRSILKELLSGDPDISVVGEASNGEKAVQMTGELNPDLIIMDINMPVMDGITATSEIMQRRPTSILIFSTEVEADVGFRACQAGAVDVMKKPDIGQFSDAAFKRAFTAKLLAVAGRGDQRKVRPEPSPPERAKSNRSHITANPRPAARTVDLVVMGASTGGPSAVRTVLSNLPAGFRGCIALVQHLETGFDRGYVDWLNEATPLDVILVEGRTGFRPASVFVAPIDKHLEVAGRSLVLTDGEKVLNQKPAVDVLFGSAAAVLGDGVLGVLLTGMGRDGARGCVEIITGGGVTIVEDESTAAIFGMPKAAIELEAATYVMPLPRIADGIRRVVGG